MSGAKSFLSKPINAICSGACVIILGLSVTYLVTQSETTTVQVADTTGDALGVGTGSFVGGVPDFFDAVSRTVNRSEVLSADGSDGEKQKADQKKKDAEKKGAAPADEDGG